MLTYPKYMCSVANCRQAAVVRWRILPKWESICSKDRRSVFLCIGCKFKVEDNIREDLGWALAPVEG